MIDFSDVKVLCLGDIMLDRFVYGKVTRVSPEAPIPIVQVTETRLMLGGVGNVARNLDSLGARTVLIGLVGNDSEAGTIRRLIGDSRNIEDRVVVSASYQTICKERVIGAHQQVVRIDYETVRPLTVQEEDETVAHVQEAVGACDCIVLSDYAKGMLTRSLVARVMAIGRAAGIPILVDPKQADLTYYAGATLIKPNLKELAEAVKMPVESDDEVAAAAQAALEMTQASHVLVTRSEKGIMLMSETGGRYMDKSRALEVFDVSGAGDTVIATVAASMGSGMPIDEAVHMANVAAGLVVAKLGTATLTPEELTEGLDKAVNDSGSSQIAPLTRAAELVRRWRAQGLKVGFTNGCFDIIHSGHVSSLKGARKLCNRLVVALNSDSSVTRLKGPKRPVNGLEDRAAVLAALDCVDLVVAFEEDTPLEVIKALRPNILFKGADYKADQVVGAREVIADGGELVLLDLVPGRSTTAVIEKVASA